MVASTKVSTGAVTARAVAAKCRRVFNSVLLVEDNEANATGTRAILESRGLQVHLAKDGGQAHSAMSMYKPECVISELILTGESGFELCGWVKQRHPGVPFVVLTEVTLDSAHRLARRVGADAYVMKPVVPARLLRLIDDIAEEIWIEKQTEQPEEDAMIHFHCGCGAKLREEISSRGKAVTCPRCRDRLIVPRLSTREMRILDSDAAVSLTRNEQEQFWRVTMRYVTIKCRECATYFRLFTSDKSTSTVCPKCRKEQAGPLCVDGAPLTRAAMASSLRVLKILNGKHSGKRIMLPRHEVMLGSSNACEIRRQSCGWNKEHCAMRPSVRGVIVRDLGSHSGTYVNGELIEGEAILPAGGLLHVGNIWFRLVGTQTPESPETSTEILLSAPTKIIPSRSEQKPNGKLVYDLRNTGVEAAKVIQEYWEVCRQRALQQLASGSKARA